MNGQPLSQLHGMMCKMFTGPRLLTCAAISALLLGACGVTVRGELTALECRDGVDNDRDGLSDCQDSDCWVYFESCPDAGNTLGNVTGKDGGSQAGQGGLPPGSDASGWVPDDAGNFPSVPADAAVPPQCGVDGGLVCDTKETCVLGACVPKTATGNSYVLRIPSAFIPDQSPGTICFDTVGTTGVCSVSPAFLCGNCKPDPYVVTTLNEVMVAKTSVATDTVAPAWSDPGFEVTLEPGDVLRFTVLDSDPLTGNDAVIFWCSPKIEVFQTASAIQCPPDADSDTIPAIPPTQFAITIESSPRGPTAE
jgi:C2 domain